MFYPPRTEAPGHSDTLEKHEEQQTHSTRGVLIKQLEHVDSSLEIELNICSTSCKKIVISTRSFEFYLRDARQSNNVGNCAHCQNKQLLVASTERENWVKDWVLNKRTSHRKYFGNSSTMAVMKPSIVQNWESRPRNISMKKKQADQTGEKGICSTALG